MKKNHLITSNNGLSEYVNNTGSKIKQSIQEASLKLSSAKSRVVSSRDAYKNTPWYKPITKRKLKKDYRNAMDELTIANSESNIQIFQILHSIIDLILIAFVIPMKLIKGLGEWCANGFEERDAVVSSLITTIVPVLKNNRGGRRKNVLEGCIRILIVILGLLLIIFIFSKLFSHKKESTGKNQELVVMESEMSQDISNVNTIDSLQKQISELEASLNELKNNQQNIIHPANEGVSSDSFISQNIENSIDSLKEENVNKESNQIENILPINEGNAETIVSEDTITNNDFLIPEENIINTENLKTDEFSSSSNINDGSSNKLDDLDIDSLLEL